MRARAAYPILIMLFLLGSACQLTDNAQTSGQITAQQTPDRPFSPLQITLSAPQNGIPSNSPVRAGDEIPYDDLSSHIGDLDAAITSTTDAMLSAINIRRALEGWPPLVRHTALTEIARNRAVDMSVHDYLSHEDPETSEIPVEESLIEMGYHGQVAELVYAANTPLDRLSEIAIADWFDDPDTRAVLLSPGFRFIGIGMMGDGTMWKVVQVLAEQGP